MINEWVYTSDGRLKVNEVDYHRNGISGNGFDIVNFIWQDGKKHRKMMAVLFEGQGNCAVFDQEMLGQGNIKFGENSWRGDNFEKTLRNEIKIFYDDIRVKEKESIVQEG